MMAKLHSSTSHKYNTLGFAPIGSGAYVVHAALARNINSYELIGYNPIVEYCPIFMKWLGRNQASLIHAPIDYGTLFHRRSVPLVLTCHNYVLDTAWRQHSNLKQRFHYATDLRFFTQSSIKKATCITTVSKYVGDLMRRDMKYSRELPLIYNGININEYLPITKKRQKDFRIFYSGNLSRRKGAYLLPEIARQLIAGCRIYYTQGLRTHNTLPDSPNLIPIGPVLHKDMPARYAEMDILILPSFREGCSMAVIEAMACGLPVVASNSSSLPELVVDGLGGYLCEPGNTIDFANKINRLVNAPELRKEMGQYNRERAERLFSLDKMVKTYERLFDKILDGALI
jgi:L-malate glycosyltransferase